MNPPAYQGANCPGSTTAVVTVLASGPVTISYRWTSTALASPPDVSVVHVRGRRLASVQSSVHQHHDAKRPRHSLIRPRHASTAAGVDDLHTDVWGESVQDRLEDHCRSVKYELFGDIRVDGSRRRWSDDRQLPLEVHRPGPGQRIRFIVVQP